eukprot:14623714-Ditylum_brightwellii.AAC.1
MLASTKYTKQHNKICKYLYWCNLNPNWHKHKRKPAMLISNQLLVTYNMTQEVDNTVKANRPDVVVLNEKERKALIIDDIIPMKSR